MGESGDGLMSTREALASSHRVREVANTLKGEASGGDKNSKLVRGAAVGKGV